ncbi:MAG: iron ABC transporter permease [Candidatus Methanogranum gryphiswaldense]|nr:MAG: iron ABC transporter permease [Candidatus Methanogranum sp. U3.2.1]
MIWTWLILAVIFIVILYVISYIFRKNYWNIKERSSKWFNGDSDYHSDSKRRRIKIMISVGIVVLLVAFIAALCIGPTKILSVPDMFSALISAISKGGQNLTSDEMLVYDSRLPRTLAAIGVGIGLSVAGAMYQAIIRNPLVDPYIMGVSAGAGTAAIAVIAFDFTFFGLFAQHSIYLTAFTAIVGGLVAFACTMILAEKAGGTTNSYVLSGVVIGMIFSAIQTIMMVFAGTQVTSALLWLFGSFSNITWSQVWLMIIPILVMSIICFRWAKEFNLVLLGDEQAKQMGLNAKRFNRVMLIVASVLTSFCVAFVGIIGFVGLVIPHLCRMILGGDHRLVLPASMAFGGALVVFTDIVSRTILPGQELPVGAITTLIGIPVFAYLLIKRGKMYEG